MPPESSADAAGIGASPATPRFDDERVGVYLHLPYCERICPYCDFAVVAAKTLDPQTQARYTAALLSELALRRAQFEGRSLASVYFGGGTPSLFAPERIAEILRGVREAFPTSEADDANLETTLEVNPRTTEIEALPDFRRAGINRLSIGVQSFDDGLLKRLGRAHRADLAHKTLTAARSAGFDNLSFDLIFAGPGQSIEDLGRDLDALLEYQPEHVSTYELTYEPQTPFGRALAAGKLAAPDEDLSVAMIETIEARLAGAHYERYEISSYARAGRRAQHNSRYWNRQAVLGLGMGAHSTEARSADRPHGARFANPRVLTEWLCAIERGALPGVQEPLTKSTARGEAVFLALRKREGLSAKVFAAEFGEAPRAYFGEAIDRLLARGWLVEGEGEERGGDLKLTAAGRLLADSVAMEFVSTREAERD